MRRGSWSGSAASNTSHLHSPETPTASRWCKLCDQQNANVYFPSNLWESICDIVCVRCIPSCIRRKGQCQSRRQPWNVYACTRLIILKSLLIFPICHLHTRRMIGAPCAMTHSSAVVMRKHQTNQRKINTNAAISMNWDECSAVASQKI